MVFIIIIIFISVPICSVMPTYKRAWVLVFLSLHFGKSSLSIKQLYSMLVVRYGMNRNFLSVIYVEFPFAGSTDFQKRRIA